ncbi:MAG: hypothetical protein HXS52_13755 [Theionarchaea archaeon]|nr:hypothetical protein [Theionarchaea archaeon]MBU7038988.1 hypothetical protein [Theionarchaea archaeon]
MHVTFQETKSALYFGFWILFVIGVMIWWFRTFFDFMYEIALPLICGCTVGVLSGLSPARLFLACFLGFSIVAILITLTSEDVFWFFLLLGISCGLIALACAMLRRIILRSKTELPSLATWQWAVLIGGASALGDFLLIPDSYTAVVQFHLSRLFAEVLTAIMIGLAGLGLSLGAFCNFERQSLVKNVLKFSLGGHTLFLLYCGFRLATGHMFWKDSFFFPVILISLTVLVIGAKTGYRFKINM